MWVSQGVMNNPANGALLADTGPMVAQGRTFHAIVGADVATVFRVEHRNAANDATTESLILACGIRDAKGFMLGDIELADNERVRIVTVGAVVGNVQATLII
jgi:hypothetical protein